MLKSLRKGHLKSYTASCICVHCDTVMKQIFRCGFEIRLHVYTDSEILQMQIIFIVHLTSYIIKFL